MLKITPYIGIMVLIVSIGGIFYPKLGYFLLLVFATLMIIAPFRGRWFCGNLCPRGSFVDFWLAPISRKVEIPSILKSMKIRIPIFILLMGFMIFRIIVYTIIMASVFLMLRLSAKKRNRILLVITFLLSAVIFYIGVAKKVPEQQELLSIKGKIE